MTAPIWLRLTDTSGRDVLLRVADVVRVYESGDYRAVHTHECSEHVTDTLDAIAAALGAPVPSVAPAEVPAWRADADAAVALLVRAGWPDAYRWGDDGAAYGPSDDGPDTAFDGRVLWRPGGASTPLLGPRNGRPPVDSARIIIRDAVERGEAPDMDAARAMVAEWDAAGGGA